MTKIGLFFFLVLIALGCVYIFKVNNLNLMSSANSVTASVLGQTSVLGQSISNVSEDENKISLKVGSVKVLLSKKKDIGMQIQALQELLKQLRMDERNIQIDLRFDKAVVSNY